nr:hypothetical protein [Rhizobium album]
METRVLNALRTKLVDPELFAHFCAVFTQEMNRLRIEGRAGIAGAETEMAKIERELTKLLTAIKAADMSIGPLIAGLSQACFARAGVMVLFEVMAS